MSTHGRVLIVARHFWPTTTDQTLRLRDWTLRLLRSGFQPTVVTPRWHPAWPRKIELEEISVVRIEHPPSSKLQLASYWRSLAEWSAREARNFDWIVCDEADGDALAVASRWSAQVGPPVIVRYDPRDIVGVGAETPRPTARMLDACRQASVVWAPTAAAQQQLLSLGIPANRVQRITDPPGAMLDRSAATRTAARQVLANINQDLFSRFHDKVVVCPGELTREWGVESLVRGLAPLLEQQRSLKLWILGDGHQRGRIYDVLQFYGLHRIVALPGVFTSLEHVLQAADLCILPAARRGLSWLLPTCIASSLPVLAADCGELRAIEGEQTSQLAFPAGDESAIGAWVRNWLRDPVPAARAVAAVRERILAEAHRGVPLAGLTKPLERGHSSRPVVG